ncbi:Hypothetical protein HVIM_03194 (plasmid) [Roseomonas mucosa]|uniref:Domain of uncharacterized function (DUF2825) n=1 Tax=Roseomonas mucosa TaxID=207340 RepID=A0A379PK77_9PROT|nr:Hypothetical protein HVIM_03194 [Roseomonas mucosa]QDD97932.1 Hypothetical protein ADP8_03194 [Roseomonas mucosa]UZO94131.1 Hypothetical protein RMP42_03194 [Roseomonas mucosa]SUE95317.1 Domain of uncharacterised function (DUF2825) [Roseomonas mucosa]
MGVKISPRIGSSPRSRGTRSSGPACRRREGFIPALAGNTLELFRYSPVPAVHPRARGEHCSPSTGVPSGVGSSPRSRGTRPRRGRQGVFGRFIPALAGNTMDFGRSLRRVSVHPRARGEHRAFGRAGQAGHGSSPRSRGTRTRRETPPAPPRFIPALAGNTWGPRRAATSIPVHPRARGEHPSARGWWVYCRGSSPRSRGTLCGSGRRRRIGRFIPALAGNTRTARDASSPPPVHPRARGEHAMAADEAAGKLGSSPRSRGTPWRPPCPPVVSRFIPALAGNTRRGSLLTRWRAVHPRARGEHMATRRTPAVARGSSPRSRGTPGPGHCCGGCRRFIPALAGNTSASRAAWSSRSVHPRARGEHWRRRSMRI